MTNRLNEMIDKKLLIGKVIEQIIIDYNEGDTTAVWELLSYIPSDNLLDFLPEDQWPNFTNQ